MRPNADGALDLVLGVMTSPSARLNRDNLRALSHAAPDIAQRAHLACVLGDVHCARNSTTSEASKHGDIVYIDGPDCTSWYRAEFRVVHPVRRCRMYRGSPRWRTTPCTEFEPAADRRARPPRAVVLRHPGLGGSAPSRRVSWWRQRRGYCGGCFAKALSPYPQAARCSSGASCPCHAAPSATAATARTTAARSVLRWSSRRLPSARSRCAAGRSRGRSPTAICRPMFAALSRRGDALRDAASDAVQAQALYVRAIGATGRRDVAADELHGVSHEQGLDYVRSRYTTLAWSHPAESFKPARSRLACFTDLPYAAPRTRIRCRPPRRRAAAAGMTLTATASIQP